MNNVKADVLNIKQTQLASETARSSQVQALRNEQNIEIHCT